MRSSRPTTQKTLLIAALAASLTALYGTGVHAEEAAQPTDKTVTLGAENVPASVTGALTWDDAWSTKIGATNGGTLTLDADATNTKLTIGEKGALTLKVGAKTAKVKLNAPLVVEKGGSFTNASDLTVAGDLSVLEGGALANSGTLAVTGTDGTKAAVSVTVGEPTGKNGTSFSNTGTITLDKADFTIGTAATTNKADAEVKEALDFGNVTVGAGSTLTNKVAAYTTGEGDKAATHNRITFGTVTVDGADAAFVNAKDASDLGKNLVLRNSGSAKVDGTSSWSSVSAAAGSKITVGETGVLKLGSLAVMDAAAGSSLATYIEKNDKSKVSLADGIAVESFAQGGDFSVTKDNVEGFGLGDGAALIAGSALTGSNFKQNDTTLAVEWDKQPEAGTLKISGFAAKWEADTATTTADGQNAGADKEEPKGSWTNRKFGSVAAYDTAVVEIADNKFDKTGYTGDATWKAALEMSSLTLASSKITTKFETELTDTNLATAIDQVKAALTDAGVANDKLPVTTDWTVANFKDKVAALAKEHGIESLYDDAMTKYAETFAGALGTTADVEHKITGSDVRIGTLGFTTVAGNGQTITLKTEKTATTADKDAVKIAGEASHVMTNQKLTIADSRVEAGTFSGSTAGWTMTSTDSNLFIGSVRGAINGSIAFTNGFLGLNSATGQAALNANAELYKSGNVVEVGDTVTIGSTGALTVGSNAALAAGDKAQLQFADDAELRFDASTLTDNAVFSADGDKKGTITIDSGKKLTVNATNLTWGRVNIFENFEDLTEDQLQQIDASGSTAGGIWKDQVQGNVTVNKDGSITLGGETVAGSGLEDVNARNLVNMVFSGNRTGANDLTLVNAILASGKSIAEVRDTINSLTGVGAAAAVNAMAIDFGSYAADQIEHHAVTIPKTGEGWWVMPIGSMLKTDDLSLGSTAGGYSIDTFGIMGGWDGRYGDWMIGAAGSYQSGEAESEGDVARTTTDVTNWGAHLWASKTQGQLVYTGALSVSRTSGDAKMKILGGDAEAEVESTAISALVRADWRNTFGAMNVTPHAGLRVSHFDVDDYDVTWNGHGVFTVSEDKAWIFEVPVGVTFSTSFPFSTWTATPYVDMTVRGRFGDTESSYTVTGSTADTIDYDISGDFIGDLKLGYMSTYKWCNLGMSYGLSAGDAGRMNHSVEATMRLLW